MGRKVDPDVERMAIVLYALRQTPGSAVPPSTARRWWKQARQEARDSCRDQAVRARALLSALAIPHVTEAERVARLQRDVDDPAYEQSMREFARHRGEP